MIKTCVIIDDFDQSEVFNTSIKETLHKMGYTVEGIIIDPSKNEFLDDEANIDINKLTQKLEEEFKRHIDIVATDFELSDNNVNGLSVVKLLREMRPKVPIVIYSGKLNEVIQSVLGDYKSKSNEELIRSISELIKLNISDFLGRDEYPNKVNQILVDKKINSSTILSKRIREYSDMTFKSCYPKFQSKKLEHIANEIDKQTYSGLEFQEEIIEQVIAYLINTNKDE